MPEASDRDEKFFRQALDHTLQNAETLLKMGAISADDPSYLRLLASILLLDGLSRPALIFSN